MTLAPPLSRIASTGDGATQPTVTAVVVSHRDPIGLADVLGALLEQSRRPDRVLVVDRTSGRASPAPRTSRRPVPSELSASTTAGGPDPLAAALVDIVAALRVQRAVPVDVVVADPRMPLRGTVFDVIRADPIHTDLLWVLPAGAVPEPGALAALVDAWSRSPSTGMVGPKHVDATSPHRLRAVGIHATRAGRVLARPVPGEPDQGQYDLTTDVLAVPLAGALIERDVVLALRGWETALGDVAADLDLGWRAQTAGRRVVVAPAARVRSEPGVAVATATTSARRLAARRVALARSSWWVAPAFIAWVAFTSSVAALALLFLKRPRAAWAELTSLGALDPIRGVALQWRTRQRRVVARRDLRGLFEPWHRVLTAWGDNVHHALISPRPPIGEGAHELNPRSWVAQVMRHPGVQAVVASATVAALAARTLGVDTLTGVGQGLVGGELIATRADAADSWSAWSDGWTGGGLGGPGSAGPAAAILAVPAWIVDHLPLVSAPASPVGLVVALLLLLGMPLAAASAYAAFRVTGAGRRVRAVGALCWATTPVAAGAVAQGRLGAVVALVLLPAIAAGLWLIAVRRSTATSAFATALAAVVLGAFAPVLLAPIVVFAVVLALVRRGVRSHAAVVGVVPAVLLAPWFRAADGPSSADLLGGHGLASWGGTAPQPWRIALLETGSPTAAPWWSGTFLVVVGVVALVYGGHRRSGWTLAALLPVALAGALVTPRLRLGSVPAGRPDAGAPITLWPGTLLLPVALVLVLAIVVALAPPGRRSTRTARIRRSGAVAAALAAVSATAVLTAVGGFGDILQPARDPRPGVSVEQSDGAFATRSLFVAPGTTGAGYRFVGRESADVTAPLPAGAAADANAAGAVAGLLGGSSRGTDLVSATAIDLLAIRSGDAPPEVVRRLDALDGFSRVATRDGWDRWRIRPVGARSASLVAAPRLRLDTDSQSRLVPTTGGHGSTRTALDIPAGARLVVAEPAAWARHATVAVDGRVLQPVPDAAAPTYELPAGPGELTIDLDTGRGWRDAQLAGLMILGFLAVPFGRRESRAGQR
jgi:GT2 family glycosyltransferase